MQTSRSQVGDTVVEEMCMSQLTLPPARLSPNIFPPKLQHRQSDAEPGQRRRTDSMPLYILRSWSAGRARGAICCLPRKTKAPNGEADAMAGWHNQMKSDLLVISPVIPKVVGLGSYRELSSFRWLR